MLDYIDSLRKKPIAVRKRIALIVSAVLTLLIFGLWATVLHFNLSQKAPDKSTGAYATTTAPEATPNPFGVFVEVFTQGWQGLLKNFGLITSGFKNVEDSIKNAATSTATSSDSVKINQ